MRLYNQDIYKIDDMLFESREVAVEWYKQTGAWKDHAYSWCELKDVVINDDLDIVITWFDEEAGEEGSAVLEVKLENFMVKVNF